jgi:hypothetical protein
MLQRSRALIAAAALMSILGDYGFTPGPAAGAEMCRLSILKFNPTETVKYATYVGKGKNLEIVITNDTGKRADSFSDPPYRVRHRDGKDDCGIDGGNWLANGLYLSDDEGLLVAVEFSGSSTDLVFYETASCTRKAAFDVSGAQWSITENTIDIAAHYADETRKKRIPKKTIRLSAKCLPN